MKVAMFRIDCDPEQDQLEFSNTRMDALNTRKLWIVSFNARFLCLIPGLG
jgi:hypothetical protein